MLNLIGEKYNYLTVIGVDRVVKGKGTYWKCKCDCGNETVVIGQYLRNGHAKSCGCLGRYRAIENLEKSRGNCFENLSGMVFGRLTVTPYFEKRGRHYYWKCICYCGSDSDIWVRASHLKDGGTQSCGCLAKEISSKVHTKHGMSKTRFIVYGLDYLIDAITIRCKIINIMGKRVFMFVVGGLGKMGLYILRKICMNLTKNTPNNLENKIPL